MLSVGICLNSYFRNSAVNEVGIWPWLLPWKFLGMALSFDDSLPWQQRMKNPVNYLVILPDLWTFPAVSITILTYCHVNCAAHSIRSCNWYKHFDGHEIKQTSTDRAVSTKCDISYLITVCLMVKKYQQYLSGKGLWADWVLVTFIPMSRS